jgi:hypothetical protein
MPFEMLSVVRFNSFPHAFKPPFVQTAHYLRVRKSESRASAPTLASGKNNLLETEVGK